MACNFAFFLVQSTEVRIVACLHFETKIGGYIGRTKELRSLQSECPVIYRPLMSIL